MGGKSATKPDIKKWCKWWGIVLIVVGAIILFLININLGVIVLLIGLTSLLFRKDWNLAMIGAFLILLGGLNIMVQLNGFHIFVDEEFSFVSLFLGIVQLVVGIIVLTQYYKVDGKEVSGKKKILIIGLISLVLILLIPTYLSEATIRTEQIRLEDYGDFFTSKDFGSEYYLNKGLESGIYSPELVNNQLSELEKRINESERKIKDA